jgi:TRAP transporter 4TM/12TM fusion protein
MLYIVIYVTDLLPMLFGVGISGPIHIGIFLGLILFLAFLIFPAKRGAVQNKPKWYDIILALVSLVPTLYYSLFFDTLLFELAYTSPINAYLGWLLMVLVWEAARRTLGWPFAGLVAVAIIYLLFGSYFPGFLKADSYSWQKIGGFMYLSRDGILGIPINIAGKIIITFMLFAQLLSISGAGDWFVKVANSLTGHVRGGPAKASIIASGGFGMIAPSPPGNVASTGVVTIPLMKKMGFKATYAAGVEAVASTGGQIMPPIMGSVIFILSEFIGMPYGQVIIYAFLPAALYYLALFVMVDLNAAKLGIKGVPRSELPAFVKTVRQGYWYLIPVVVLLICLIPLSLSPAKAAIWALFTLIIITMFRKNERMNPGKLVKGAEGGMRALLPIAVGCAGCGIIIGSLTLSLLSFRLTFQLVEAIGQNLIIILILAAVISYIMGMGVGPLASYLTLAVMVAPAVMQMGVPTLAAHLFLFYWSVTCFITPPYAVAVFVAAGIAECSMWRAAFQAMLLGIGTYIVPFIFVYQPALLLIGTPLEIVIVVGTSLIGIVSIAAGITGYIIGNLNWIQRALLIAGGGVFCLTGGMEQVIAAAAVLAVIVWHVLASRLKRSSLGS